jgi:hypothetical protein
MPRMIHHRIEVSENPYEMRNCDLECCVAWRHQETEMLLVAEGRLAAAKRMTLEVDFLKANNKGQV